MEQAAAGKMRAKRTTQPLGAWVEPGVIVRAKHDAQRYGMTLSAYVSALVGGDDPRGKVGADLTPLALAGNRVMRAMEAVTARANAGDDVGLVLDELRGLQREIAGTLYAMRSAYDAVLDKRPGRPDDWSSE